MLIDQYKKYSINENSISTNVCKIINRVLDDIDKNEFGHVSENLTILRNFFVACESKELQSVAELFQLILSQWYRQEKIDFIKESLESIRDSIIEAGKNE